MDLPNELKKLLGSANVIDPKGNPEYSRDRSYMKAVTPSAIVMPRSADDVSRLLKFCNDRNINIVARGGGSSLTGSSIPHTKGVVIDLSKLNRILETHIEDMYVVAEPCVTIDQLNRHLSKYRYFYPPEPASSEFATVGGTISTNAGGLKAVTYGSTKEWILGAEIALMDGKRIWVGSRTSKRSIGYDLTGLIVGSEGTLGVVTKAILKIWPKPETFGRILAYYKGIDDAAKGVGALKRSGIIPITAEFMDADSMQLMRQHSGLRIPEKAEYMLIVDIPGNRESMKRLLDTSERLLKRYNPISLKLSTSSKEMGKMYAARKDLYFATQSKAQKQSKSVVIADTIVPSSELPAALKEMKKIIKHQKLEVVLFGHIGDGNIHANIIADTNKENAMVELLQHRFCTIALKHNGSVSGEHGIGSSKKKLLAMEFASRNSSYSLELMKGIKKDFDPKGLLNKGKIFD